MSDVEIIEGEGRVGSFLISQGLDREHKSVLQLINDFKEDLEKFGKLPERKLCSTGGRAAMEYLLNLNQMLFIAARMRNSKKTNAVVSSLIANSDIIKAFELIKEFDTDDVPCRYVYAAIDGQRRIKIGISNNPEKRVANLNIGNADKLELVFTKRADLPGYKSEVILHEKCSAFRIRSEWYTAKALEELS